MLPLPPVILAIRSLPHSTAQIAKPMIKNTITIMMMLVIFLALLFGFLTFWFFLDFLSFLDFLESVDFDDFSSVS